MFDDQLRSTAPAATKERAPRHVAASALARDHRTDHRGPGHLLRPRLSAADLGLPRRDRAVGLAERGASGPLQHGATARARAGGLAAGVRHCRACGAAVPDRGPAESVRVPVSRAGVALGDRAAAAHHADSGCVRHGVRDRARVRALSRCRGIPEDPLELPWIYLLGVWLSILLAISFIGLYAWQITEEGRQLAEALAATELVLAREQHLSQLDGLGCRRRPRARHAAVHHLGGRQGTRTCHRARLAARRRRAAARRTVAALPRHPCQADRAFQRRTVRPHAAVGADRGGGGSAPQLRRRDRCRTAASTAAAGRRAQPGDPLRPRQPS